MSREYVLQPFRAPVHLQIDYARELNEQQYAAVTAPPGPSLVIAGAGSGKTRTLIYRVAYLLEQGIPAERILLLTFTNKAAKEMMRRVADLLGQELASLWGGTFHSIGNRILRQHADLLGYQRDFTILDREDAKHLISTCVAESEVDVKATRFPKAEVLGDIFSLAVNTHKTIPEMLKRAIRLLRAPGAADCGHPAALCGAQAGHERDGLRRLAGALAQAHAGARRRSASSISGASSSSWWMNTRTRTSCRAT